MTCRICHRSSCTESFHSLIEQINCGCMLRITDAAEKMAGNYTALQNEVAYLRKVKEDLRQGLAHLEHSNAALRGYIKRIKKRSNL